MTDTPSTVHESEIVVSLGRKGSGKSQLLAEMFVQRSPRVITLGHIRQDLERYPDVVTTVGWIAFVAQLEAASAYKRWHIAAALEPDDQAKLFGLLAPRLGTAPSLSTELDPDGIAIECGEAYDLAPNGKTDETILRAIRQSRHYRLDFFLASQRPASCAREVTAQADKIFAFAQSEPRDIQFLAATVSMPFAQTVRQLKYEDHACVMYNRDDGTARILDKDRHTVGRVDAFGDAAGRSLSQAAHLASMTN